MPGSISKTSYAQLLKHLSPNFENNFFFFLKKTNKSQYHKNN